jgi:hypothetical protein
MWRSAHSSSVGTPSPGAASLVSPRSASARSTPIESIVLQNLIASASGVAL